MSECENCPYELYRIVRIQERLPSVCEVCEFKKRR